MRKSAILVVFMAAVVVCLLPGCGGGDPDPVQETEAEKKLRLLTGSWNVQSVTVDGVDRTSVYNNIHLTITANTITSSNGGAIWPSSVTWSFTNANATQMSRTDGLTLNLDDVQQNKLQISLAWNKDTFEPGRTISVKGQHVFVFVR